MDVNVGTADRAVRFAAGILLLALALFGATAGAWTWLAAIVGLVLIGTAGLRFCPAYRVLGLRTCPR